MATVLASDSEDQKHRYLPALFTGEEPWCQLFSEPGNGSDLAPLATRAMRDGDEWVVDGQKVWTSGAHLARHALLLARTDPVAEKHAGLTAFAIDLHAPGVDVRPLRQMNGGAEFSEVFLAVPGSPTPSAWATSAQAGPSRTRPSCSSATTCPAFPGAARVRSRSRSPRGTVVPTRPRRGRSRSRTD